MIQRHIKTQILNDLTYFPAVGILGPRQVGKTTFAEAIQAKLAKSSVYLDLEDTGWRSFWRGSCRGCQAQRFRPE